MRETRYLSHAWGLLTRDRGWYTPILTLSVYMLVPVVGWLVVLGYEMEWARRVAWGFEGPPQRWGIDIPRCFQSGCRAFVAVLGWCIVWVVLYCAVAMAVTRSYLGPLADALDTLMLIRMLPWFLLSAWSPVGWPLIVVVSFCTVLTVMVGVRATIYQDSAAGYQISRIVEMIKRDAGGYAKISGLVALVALVCEFAPLLLSYVLAFIGVFLDLAGGVLFVLFLYPVIFLLMAVYCTVVFLLIHTMVGLWMRQFDVPSWGKSTDSLPAGQRPSSDARLGSLGGGTSMPRSPTSSGSPSSRGRGQRISSRGRMPLLRPVPRLGYVPLTSSGACLHLRDSLAPTKRVLHLLALLMGVTYVLFPTHPLQAIDPRLSILPIRSHLPSRRLRRSPLSRQDPAPLRSPLKRWSPTPRRNPLKRRNSTSRRSPLSRQMPRPPWAQRRAGRASARTRISKS